ncbi:hypothetical protein B0T14DRAFT_565025 [Immersiella caudata]|uniref:Uncharacterized protein n=1 Tax=Immersiella caudata TaxID=314043 RepID=A0AA39WXY9_9PEZI|nr:hypothetical protein B0T14DRAFT_565025 [Immersiella caudata]
MKFSINASLLGIASLPAVSAGIGNGPVITTAPEPTRIAARATTSFYSFVTTPIPNNDRSIGMGLQREGTDEYYWLYCIDEPFTVRSGFAGCGNDDVYTTCSGRVASGIDGDEIRCDQQCVTHKVYKDLDVTTFTPLIGCGRGTSTMNLVRTSTGSNSPKTGGGDPEKYTPCFVRKILKDFIDFLLMSSLQSEKAGMEPGLILNILSVVVYGEVMEV